MEEAECVTGVASCMVEEDVSLKEKDVCNMEGAMFVKEETRCDNRMDTMNAKEAAYADPYTNHKIKDELGIGPEEVQKQEDSVVMTDLHEAAQAKPCSSLEVEDDMLGLKEVQKNNTVLSKCEECSLDVCVQKIKSIGISKLSDTDLQFIIEKGRQTPDLQMYLKYRNHARKLDQNQYDLHPWLTGCVHTNRLFCFPCLLFSNSTTVWNQGGYSDLDSLCKAVKQHDHSEAHIQASLKLSLARRGIKTLNQGYVEKHNAIVDQNRSIFQRLVDIICFLCEQEMPFYNQGFFDDDDDDDDESSSDINSNFVTMVNFVATYDGALENHLKDSSGSFSVLSKEIQNDVVYSIASVLDSAIKEQIAATDFVAVMLEDINEGGDVCLAVILRYFHESELCNRFIKYVDFTSDRVATISNVILEILKEFDCSSKLIAQTYNGSVVSSSDFIKIQGLVCKECPRAVNVWCSAHPLNLVLMSCIRVPGTFCFFGTIKRIAKFFQSYTRRQEHYNKMAELKNLPQYDWKYNPRIVNAIFDFYPHLIDVLEDMSENVCFDGRTSSEASLLLDSIDDFDFQFLLRVFNKIFTETDALDEAIRIRTWDGTYCIEKLKELQVCLDSFSSEFDDIFDDAKREAGPPITRPNVVDARENYKRIFFEILENIYKECHYRYQNVGNLNYLQILTNENFNKYKEQLPLKLVNEYLNAYNSVENNAERLTNELKVFYKTEDFQNLTVYNLIENLYENLLDPIFPEVLRLAKHVVTNPAYSDSSEKLFSSLERILAYFRNTKGEPPQSEVAKISIAKSLLTELKRRPDFYESVLKVYLQKDRREDFTYIKNEL